MFFQQGQHKKLWQKIGIDRPHSHSFPQEIELIESEIDQKKGSPQQSLKQSIIQERLRIDLLLQDKRPAHKKEGYTKTEKFQNLIDKLNLEVRQFEESEHMIVGHQEFEQGGSISNFEQLDEFYNYEISHAPESVTPLLYSKNLRKIEEIKFRKDNARLVVIKQSVSEFKQSLKILKQDLQLFFEELIKQQDKMREQICAKYYDLQRQYQLKIQESIFKHKEEYLQLKNQYEILKTKEQKENNKLASTTQLFLPERDVTIIQRQNESDRKNEELIKENTGLKQKLDALQLERDKLLKETSDFKRKITEIEAFTVEIKQSNDKLYEYIFDLEQKLAYHKEEVPTIKKMITQELTQYYQRHIEKIEAERRDLQLKNQALLQQLKNLADQNLKLKEDAALSEKQIEKLRKTNQNYKTQETEILKLNQQRINDLLNQVKLKDETILRKDEQIGRNRRLIEEKDIMLTEYVETINRSRHTQKNVSPWEYQQVKNKNRNKNQESRIDTQGIEIRQDRKHIETLQIDKVLLQRQNQQLKGVIEFYSKMGNNFTLPVPPPVSISRGAQNMPNYYLPRQTVCSQASIPQPNLSSKQRELLKYQGYLQSQAQRLEIKQKEIDIEMAVRKTLQHKHREPYHVPQRKYEIATNQDDYGMRQIAANPIKVNHHNIVSPGNRKNNFCSSEAQAIIEKVKMRQLRKNEEGCFTCMEPRCRCDVFSKGSRRSRQSNSREYMKMQQYRPKNSNPGLTTDEYLRRDDKNSKMKLIEDKVKRLKSQLKNSLSSMKD